MPDAQAHDSRHARAERNVEAILDATWRLLARHEQPNISAVATAADVSRPTVYAHFADRNGLLEALVERTVRRATATISSAEPESGPAAEALQRLIAASWQEIAEHREIAHACGAHLDAAAMRRAHDTARGVIEKLIERGRRERAFRTDLPTDWLVTCCLALIHAAAQEVRAGHSDADSALEVLSRTISDLLAR